MSSNEVDNSIWLFDVLNTIGINDEYRIVRRNQGIICEILESFEYRITTLNMGSTIEGTDSPGEPSDKDVMRCVNRLTVVEDIDKTTKKDESLLSLLIVRESNTPPGYVKLQLVKGDIPCTSENCPANLYGNLLFKIDEMGRIVLSDLSLSGSPEIFKRTKNKPAEVTIGKFQNYELDTVTSFRCKTWPRMAHEWLHRQRNYGWPTKETVEELKSYGCFVVRKGHPFSSDIDSEWRISFSLQERKLMFNLTDVQHKCYVVLKMLNRDVINFDCITTYHWKTCLFYAIEENSGNIWEKKRLWFCIQLCIRQMLKWIQRGFCPNYFIPEENVFDGRLDNNLRFKSEKKIKEILNDGFDSLLLVKTNNICDYVSSRGSQKRSQRLHANSRKVFEYALRVPYTRIIHTAMSAFNHGTLEHYSFQADYNTFNFIRSMWLRIEHIQHSSANINSGHTEKETQSSLSLMLPYIYTCLASNISAIAIQNPNPEIRNFLFLGSFTYFMKGDLQGRLKFISVMYAAKLYNDCEWWIDNEDEEYIKNNPSLCRCRYIMIDQQEALTHIINTKPLKVSSCVSFLPTELLIVPDAMKYEMFRFVGISLHDYEKNDKRGRWHYRAIVDSNIYFFFLKYLIKTKLGRIKAQEDATLNILKLLQGTNVRHRDVAFNVLTWIFYSEMDTHKALRLSTLSWWTMNNTDMCLAFAKTEFEMKRKQYLYNAAKIHALVILYNTWFEKKWSSVHFCFQCFYESPLTLLKCSRCKVSTYCDKQCQRKNWKIHKKTCKIVRKL